MNYEDNNIKILLKKYGAKDEEIENFMKDLSDSIENIVEDAEDEDEYDAQSNIESVLSKDFDLEKDKDLKDLIAKKYAKPVM